MIFNRSIAKFITLISLGMCLLPLGQVASSNQQNERNTLEKGSILLNEEKDDTEEFKKNLSRSGASGDASRFLIQIERQIFSLAETFERALQNYGHPTYQTYKTKVCTDTSHLIATSRAMIRVLNSSPEKPVDTQDFEGFILELAQVKRDLRCSV